MSVHLLWAILAGCVELLRPGNDLGEECDELGSLSLSFKNPVKRNNYRHICGQEETLNDILGLVIFHHLISLLSFSAFPISFLFSPWVLSHAPSRPVFLPACSKQISLQSFSCRSAEIPRRMFLGDVRLAWSGQSRSAACGTCFPFAPLSASTACLCWSGAWTVGRSQRVLCSGCTVLPWEVTVQNLESSDLLLQHVSHGSWTQTRDRGCAGLRWWRSRGNTAVGPLGLVGSFLSISWKFFVHFPSEKNTPPPRFAQKCLCKI